MSENGKLTYTTKLYYDEAKTPNDFEDMEVGGPIEFATMGKIIDIQHGEHPFIEVELVFLKEYRREKLSVEKFGDCGIKQAE